MSDFTGPLAWKPNTLSYQTSQAEWATRQTNSMHSTTSSSTVPTHGHFGPADMASPSFTAPSPDLYGGLGEDMGHLDAPLMFLPAGTNGELAGLGEFVQDLPQYHRELRPAPDRNCQHSGGPHGAQRHRSTGAHRRTTSIKALTR